MKKLTRLLALLLAMLLCLPALAETADGSEVLAKVNDLTVTRAELDATIANLTSYYASEGYDTNDAEFQTIIQQLAMETLVQYRLMDIQLVALGLSLTEEERTAAETAARADWNATMQSGLSYYGVTETSTEEEEAAALVKVLADLESMGYTEESFVEESILYAGYDKLQEAVIGDVTVTDDQIKAHYDELVAADEQAYKNDAAAYESTQQMNMMYEMYGMSAYVVDLYYMPEGYRGMTHILLIPDEALLTAYQNLQAKFEEQQSTLEEGGEVTDTLVTEEEVEAARKAVMDNVQPRIDEINAKLAQGAAFADLIPLYSEDPGMKDAAAIAEGYAVHMDSIMWDPVFTNASFTVDAVGEITEPVLGGYGVHILQYARDIPSGPIALTSEMAEGMRAELLYVAQSNAWDKAIESWESAATIEYLGDAAAFMAPATPEEDAPAAE